MVEGTDYVKSVEGTKENQVTREEAIGGEGDQFQMLDNKILEFHRTIMVADKQHGCFIRKEEM